MIVDSDILIWYIRGHQKAKKLLESLDDFSISAVTQMELVQGVRDKKELMALRRFIRDWEVKVILVDESICNRAVFYMEEHFLNHNLRMADALIAAAAVITSDSLITGNVKHYQMIKDLTFKKFSV